MPDLSAANSRTTAREAAAPRPRVLFVNHAASIGGGELSLLDIAADWADSGEMVLLEDGPYADRLRQRGVPVHVASSGGRAMKVTRGAGVLSAVTAIPGVLRVVRSMYHRARHADVIYAGSQKAMVVAALTGWFTGTPVIWHLRDILTASHFSRLNRTLAVLFSHLFLSRVICNSRATRRAFVDAGGPETKAVVIHNGIDPAPFQSRRGEERSALRERLGLPVKPRLVGVFSRLSAWKGQDVLVEALGHLPGVHALIVGDAIFAPDEPYKKKLLAQVRHADLEDRVHFLGFRDDIPQLMHAVDVVAHTSSQPEPFGRVIVEGMLAGRPVVATRAGGAIELIEDGHTGILVQPGSADDLARGIQEALRHKAVLSEAGRQHALATFTVDHVLARVRHEIQAQHRPGKEAYT